MNSLGNSVQNVKTWVCDNCGSVSMSIEDDRCEVRTEDGNEVITKHICDHCFEKQYGDLFDLD